MTTHRVTLLALIVLASSGWCAAATSEQTVTAPKPIFGGWPSWSADGQWVTVYTGLEEQFGIRGQGMDLLQVQPASGVAQCRYRGRGNRPAWSPDPRWLAVEHRIGMILVDLKQQRAQEVVDSASTWSVTWRPDGRELAFMMARPSGEPPFGQVQLFVASFDPRRAHWAKLERVLTKPPMGVSLPSWSPDGRWIAFVRGRRVRWHDVYEICRIDPRGGEPEVLWRLPTPWSVERLSWTSDSRSLCCTLSGGSEVGFDLQIVDKVPPRIPSWEAYNDAWLRGASAQEQANVERQMGGWWSESLDGRFVLARSRYNVPRQLALLDCATRAVRDLAPEGSHWAGRSVEAMAISPRGDRVAGNVSRRPTFDDGGTMGATAALDGSDLQPLRVTRLLGVELPYVTTQLDPDFPLPVDCTIGEPQPVTAHISAAPGWATIESVRYQFTRPDQPNLDFGVSYNLRTGQVGLGGVDGTVTASVEAGAETVATSRGVELLGSRCVAKDQGQFGLATIAVAFGRPDHAAAWQVRVVVTGRQGEKCFSPLMGWIDVSR